ncbi:helix-turn-helix transcriptional regulator [Patescibacteria group bacterium]|nr:helix-turn-helix transcriptional regulator [Patescibacteria group bacterium]
MVEINNRIKIYRAEFDLTQEDLANKVGVTRQTIIAMEQNKYVPSLELVFKVAKVFNQPIENIFSYK